jgi:tRNA pseudouridine55 synthase
MDPNQLSQPDPGEVILIDKPLTWTSFDPLATGLLILCTGKMTKQIDQYQAQEKEYSGTLVLGKTTPSVDLETEFDAEFPTVHITNEVMESALNTLRGNILQIPPIYSAIQVNGKRLYELARKGVKDADIVIKSREVEIKKFDVDTTNFPELSFSIICSKGTYIRSLVRDFGTACGSGAYMSSLRRERIGEFEVKNALTIEQFIESRQIPSLKI